MKTNLIVRHRNKYRRHDDESELTPRPQKLFLR
jgi:hypothetical protein